MMMTRHFFRPARLFRLTRALPGALLAAAWLACAPAALAAEPIVYGKTSLNVVAPAGFADVTLTAPEFTRAVQDTLDGELLRLYLPNGMAQRLAEGRADAVTRQVCLYGFTGRPALPPSPEKKHLEGAIRTLEAAYTGYRRAPDNIRADKAALAAFHREAIRQGASVLVEAGPDDNAHIFLTLTSYPMETDATLTAALCTALVLAGDAPLFVSASSFVAPGADPEAELDWAKSTVEAFSAMLVSAGKN